jgi:DNA-binding XRE family transcriptional regulator
MKTPENQIKNDYEMQFIANTEEVRRLRIAQNITQERMAFELKVSLRKIQHFEKFRSMDAFMIYGYRRVLSN